MGLEPTTVCLQSRNRGGIVHGSRARPDLRFSPEKPALPAVFGPHLPPFFVSSRVHLCHTWWGKPGGNRRLRLVAWGKTGGRSRARSTTPDRRERRARSRRRSDRSRSFRCAA